MQAYLLEILECPVCHGKLEWQISERRGERIETAQAHCQRCAAVYPVLEGTGLFLTPDLLRNDLWQRVDSQLVKYLKENVEVEQRLMEAPADELAPADLFYRAMVLEERGDHRTAKTLEEQANRGIYTEEYLTCWQSQRDYVVERLSEADGPIVDLASGRCYLLEEMARRLERPLVATDHSPRVLRQDRRQLESLGLYEQVSLLALDARRTPFRDGSLATLTTNLGLQNVAEPGHLLAELRRVAGGQFLAISHFYPKEDEVNAAALREAGLSLLTFRHSAVEGFVAAGWRVEVVNECQGMAKPTPASVIFAGAQIDRFPVQETNVEWCVLLAR
jgi:uncharacterized protein YbaR (Trm112 family)